ncbi:hypothetical protein [Halorubrum sp. Atlit-26R]|uniref:hypothetical protein n=1 Tax=Halorubrum sp. Atlit-26R TaxID=2282128 RepID=UPI0011C40604|nr:hypothetical protein [Halorubrum sp. Atlit-26R]
MSLVPVGSAEVTLEGKQGAVTKVEVENGDVLSLEFGEQTITDEKQINGRLSESPADIAYGTGNSINRSAGEDWPEEVQRLQFRDATFRAEVDGGSDGYIRLKLKMWNKDGKMLETIIEDRPDNPFVTDNPVYKEDWDEILGPDYFFIEEYDWDGYGNSLRWSFSGVVEKTIETVTGVDKK